MQMLREILLFILIKAGDSFHRQRYGHYPIICPTGERIQGPSHYSSLDLKSKSNELLIKVPDDTYDLNSYIIHSCPFNWTCNGRPLTEVYR